MLGALKGDAEVFRIAVVLVERPGPASRGRHGVRRGAQDFLVEPCDGLRAAARVKAAGRTKVLQEELVEQSRRFEPSSSRTR